MNYFANNDSLGGSSAPATEKKLHVLPIIFQLLKINYINSFALAIVVKNQDPLQFEHELSNKMYRPRENVVDTFQTMLRAKQIFNKIL